MLRSYITIGKRGLWFGTALALLILAASIGLGLVYERQRIVEGEFQRLTSQAKVIEDNITRQLEGVDKALLSVQRDWDRLNPSGDDQRSLLNLRLQALSDSMPGVRTMAVLNGEGEVLGSNRRELIGQNFSRRDYFITAKQQRDPSGPYLSAPFKTILGVYSSNLVRTDNDAHGELARMYVATLDPEFFSVLLSSVRFEDDVWVSLAHTGGLLILRYPDQKGLAGQNLNRPGSFFSRHMDSGQLSTMLTGHVATTGQPAWMAQRTVAAESMGMKGGFVVAVARTPAVALRSWAEVAAAGAVFWLLMSGASVALLWLLNQRQLEADSKLALEELLRKKAEAEITHMAFYDALTDLPNRRLLYDRMAQVMAAGKRHGRYSALLFMDLDGFKKLNDIHGHEQGDKLLKAVARRLQSEVRREDTAARLGGDEFVVMLPELSHSADEAREAALAIAQKILSALGQAYDLGGLTYACTASIGVTLFGQTDESTETVVNRADEAMYEAKSAGRNSIHVAQV